MSWAFCILVNLLITVDRNVDRIFLLPFSSTNDEGLDMAGNVLVYTSEFEVQMMATQWWIIWSSKATLEKRRSIRLMWITSNGGTSLIKYVISLQVD